MGEQNTNPFHSPTVTPIAEICQNAEIGSRIRIPIFSMLVVILAGVIGGVVAMCLADNEWPDMLSSKNLEISIFFGSMIGLANTTALVISANTLRDRLSPTMNLLLALIGVAILSYLNNLFWLILAGC